MEHLSIYALLKDTFGDGKVLEHVITGEEDKGTRDPFILVQTEALPEVVQFLKDNEQTQFDMLHLISGLDWQEYFESVYHIWSTKKRHWVILKVRVPRDRPAVPSIAHIYPAADWHERETYDLMGITYNGHPNLKRILLADEWEGYPLRKDYKFPEHEDLLKKGF